MRDARQNARSYSSPLHDTPFHGPLVVLTNDQTTGAAEALAACLKPTARSCGPATAGDGAVFEEHKLSSGQVLRYLVRRSLTTGRRPVRFWRQPVLPDIALTVDDRAEKAALTLIGTTTSST